MIEGGFFGFLGSKKPPNKQDASPAAAGQQERIKLQYQEVPVLVPIFDPSTNKRVDIRNQIGYQVKHGSVPLNRRLIKGIQLKDRVVVYIRTGTCIIRIRSEGGNLIPEKMLDLRTGKFRDLSLDSENYPSISPEQLVDIGEPLNLYMPNTLFKDSPRGSAIQFKSVNEKDPTAQSVVTEVLFRTDRIVPLIGPLTNTLPTDTGRIYGESGAYTFSPNAPPTIRK